MNIKNEQLIWLNILLISLVLLSCNNERQGRMGNSSLVSDSIVRDMIYSPLVTDTISSDLDSLIIASNTTGSKISENIIIDREIVHSETIMHDTIIGDYFISYIVRDNNEFISTQMFLGNGDTVQVDYSDRSVFLDLRHKDGKIIFTNKEFNKYTFSPIVPKDNITQFQLWAFHIKRVEAEGVLFYLNICIPDTDICYFIDLYISKEGEITMSEIDIVWEDDYD